MRLPLVPGPRDVIHLVERAAEAVDMLLTAAPRFMALLDEATPLVGRASRLIDGIDETRSSADALVRRTDEVVGRAEGVISRSDDVVTRTEAIISRTDDVVSRADAVVTRSDRVVSAAASTLDESVALLARLRELLDTTEPSLVKLQPILERLADTTHPEEVDALVALVDQLPLLARRMETEIVPIMESLGTVGPDIHDLLDLTRELNEMLASVPGLSRVKKRIDEEQAESGPA